MKNSEQKNLGGFLTYDYHFSGQVVCFFVEEAGEACMIGVDDGTGEHYCRWMHRVTNSDMCKLALAAARSKEQVRLYGKKQPDGYANTVAALGLYHVEPKWWNTP